MKSSGKNRSWSMLDGLRIWFFEYWFFQLGRPRSVGWRAKIDQQTSKRLMTYKQLFRRKVQLKPKFNNIGRWSKINELKNCIPQAALSPPLLRRSGSFAASFRPTMDTSNNINIANRHVTTVITEWMAAAAIKNTKTACGMLCGKQPVAVQ